MSNNLISVAVLNIKLNITISDLSNKQLLHKESNIYTADSVPQSAKQCYVPKLSLRI